MPSKKRKYEARFPPARIKKIMQTDEEIGKVAAAVPVIISRSLEIFLQSLVETTAQYTNERKAKTMTTSHLKHCIESEGKFDFLKDLVANIADIANEEDDGGEGGEKPKKQRKPRLTEKKKKKKESSSEEDTDQSDGEESGTAARSIPPSPNPSDDNISEEIPPVPTPKSKEAAPAANLTAAPAESLTAAPAANLTAAPAANLTAAPAANLTAAPAENLTVGPAEISAASSPLHQSTPSPLTPHHPPELQPQPQHHPPDIQPQPQQFHPPDIQPQPQQFLNMHPPSQGVSPRHDGLSRCVLNATAFAQEQGSASPQYALSREEVLDSSESMPRSASSSPHHSLVQQRELNLHSESREMTLQHSESREMNMPHSESWEMNMQHSESREINMQHSETREMNIQHGESSPNRVQHDPLYLNRSSPSHAMDMSFNPPSLQASSFPPNLSLSGDKASPTMPCGKGTTGSLSLPLNNISSSLGARSSLNGSPRVSSTTPNVPSPLLSSPRNVANPSNAASSPIYMPTEHRPTIIHSNVLERSEGGGRPARPSHSIDSIMGNIPSGPPKSQEEQKATISSSFMPNFNLHGNGASVPPSAPSLISNSDKSPLHSNSNTPSLMSNSNAPPFISNSNAPPFISNSNAPPFISNSNAPPFISNSNAPPFISNSNTHPLISNSNPQSLISNSFGMNFPSTFKVQNEEEDDDYDT